MTEELMEKLKRINELLTESEETCEKRSEISSDCNKSCRKLFDAFELADKLGSNYKNIKDDLLNMAKLCGNKEKCGSVCQYRFYAKKELDDYVHQLTHKENEDGN